MLLALAMLNNFRFKIMCLSLGIQLCPSPKYQKIYLLILLPDSFFFLKNIYCIVRKTFEKSHNLHPCLLSSNHPWYTVICLLQRRSHLLSGEVTLLPVCMELLFLGIVILSAFRLDHSLYLSFPILMSVTNLSSFFPFLVVH